MKLYKYLIFTVVIIGMVSCEKEIDVDVDQQQTKIVIEANISNRPGDVVVYLTESLPLNADTEYPRISNAEITITEVESGEVYPLSEVEAGVYRNVDAAGEFGNTYKLNVLLQDGQTFTSEDKMPNPVNFTGITYEKLDISFVEGDEVFFEITPEFVDIQGVDNYYQLVVKKEGESLEDVNAFKDLGFDGLPNTQRIIFEADYGDVIYFDLHNITVSAYDYLLGVDYNLGQGSATPTNPISNIMGAAFGYFKVYSADEPITIELTEENEN